MCRAGGHTTAPGVNPYPPRCAASASDSVSRGASPLARYSPLCGPARRLRQCESPVPRLAGTGPGAWQHTAAVRPARPPPAVCQDARQTAAAHGLASNASGRRHPPGLLGRAEPGRSRCAHYVIRNMHDCSGARGAAKCPQFVDSSFTRARRSCLRAALPCLQQAAIRCACIHP